MRIHKKIKQQVYLPREDTFFLLNFLKKQKYSRLRILEIGTGSGIIADFLAEKNKVIATDINEEAINFAKKNCKNAHKIKFIVSDLFEKINNEFDLIVFNPPYLPPDEYDDLISTTDNEVIINFLKKAKKYLSRKGKIILILSSLSLKKNFDYIKKNYEFRIAQEKTLAFGEKLFIYVLE